MTQLRIDGSRRSPKGAHIAPSANGRAYVWRCHACPTFGEARTRGLAIEAYAAHLPPAGEAAHVGHA